MVSSRGSRSGENFKTASGALLPNQGDRIIKGTDEDGAILALRYAVADVTTALDSVAQICDAGNSVVFDKWGGYIIGPGGKVDFKRVDDNYIRTTWVKRPRKPRKKKTVSDNDEPMPQANAVKHTGGEPGEQGFWEAGPSKLVSPNPSRDLGVFPVRYSCKRPRVEGDRRGQTDGGRQRRRRRRS